jgi:hypothetical protein
MSLSFSESGARPVGINSIVKGTLVIETLSLASSAAVLFLVSAAPAALAVSLFCLASSSFFYTKYISNYSCNHRKT